MASKKGLALLEAGSVFRKAGSVAKPSPLHGLPGISIAISRAPKIVCGGQFFSGLKKGSGHLELVVQSSRERL